MAINELFRETVVGLLYGIFMWGTRFSSPCISRRSRRLSSVLHGDDEKGYYGLSIALDPPEVENARNDDDDEKKTRILKSCMAPPPVARKSSPTSFFTLLPSELSSLWTTSTTGDFLGTESGVHMVSAEPGSTVPWENPNTSSRRTTYRRLKQEVKRWDIPPPLTWLQERRECSTVPCRPYSLNREYINGRLVLKEVAVENFEHLQATGRADTRRLPIHLVVAEDDQENSFSGADDSRLPVS